METVIVVGLILLAYFAGGIPFGFWIGKWARNIDIRNFGSGNIGATNAIRKIGWWGLVVLVLDIAKGWYPTFLGVHHFAGIGGEILGCACMVVGFLGHAFSWYMKLREGKFSGGKSVATAFGSVLALNPFVALIALAVWIVVISIAKYVSIGSMVAAVSTPFLAAILHSSRFMIVVFALTALFILYTHRRNIGRLIAKTEIKVFAKDEVVVAFAIHSQDMDDLYQNFFSGLVARLKDSGRIAEEMARETLKKSFVLEAGEINGIETYEGTFDDGSHKSGHKVRVILLGIPLQPDQIRADENEELLGSLLVKAAFIAKRRGATVLGLGGLLSTKGRGGDRLQKAIDKHHEQFGGMDLVIDNGAAYTAAATLQALENEVKVPLSELHVAIIGASGQIGLPIAEFLIGKVKHLQVVCDRNISRLKMFEGKADILIAKELPKIKDADVVLTMTNQPGAIIRPDNVLSIFDPEDKVILLDVAYPKDVDDGILALMPNARIIRCGLILLPGENLWSRIDFHFGKVTRKEKEYFLVPACLAQTVMLGLTGTYEHASRAFDVHADDVEFFKAYGESHGFEIVTSSDSEPDIYLGRNN